MFAPNLNVRCDRHTAVFCSYAASFTVKHAHGGRGNEQTLAKPIDEESRAVYFFRRSKLFD